jgi:hypothetical protein
MAEVEWLGGWPPGGVTPYRIKGCEVGWLFKIQGAEAKTMLRGVPRSIFSFEKFGEGARAAAKDYQRQIAEDHGFEIKNQYRYCTDLNDGLPYIEFHIRDAAGKDYYPTCDVGDLPLLEEHVWSVLKGRNSIYAHTAVKIDGSKSTKYFHRYKHPEWPMVDHNSKIPEENRNGLDNRDKHLRAGSGGSMKTTAGLKRTTQAV